VSTRVNDLLDQHPGIHFEDGPAGRRPKVTGSLDVWEIVSTVQDNDGSLAVAAEYLSVDPKVVETGMRYYEHHRDEIDAWLRRHYAENDRAYREWCEANGLPVKY
jgi:uncharacterized protein (DUF433 family)